MAVPLLAAIPAVLGKVAVVTVKAGGVAGKGLAVAGKGLAKGAATTGRTLSTGARSVVRSAPRKLTVKKVKSFAKDKTKEKVKGKLSKKSQLLSSESNQQEKKLKPGVMDGGVTPTLTGTTDSIKIKPASDSKSQVEQLKINVTNIHSFLVKSNNQYKKQEADTRRNERVQQSKAKLGGEEKRLEKGSSPLGKSVSKIKDAVSSTGSIFERIMNFVGVLLLGIAVNALPAIIEKVKEIVDNIVNFLTPIQSGFKVIMSFFTGDINEDELNVDKKRFDDGIQKITGKDGLFDQIKKKMGPFGFLIDLLRPAVDKIREALGLKNAAQKITLAKKGGKEGFVDVETGKFTEKQFTSEERERYEKNQNKNQTSDDEPLDQQNTDVPVDAVDGSGLKITSGMGMRDFALSPGMHMGVDIAGPEGTPLVAFTPGKLVAEGFQGGPNSGYGNYVVWTDDKGIEHFYGHLKERTSVQVGTTLRKGQVIGLMGNTGGSSGPHLHWETAKNVGDTGMPKGAVLSRFNPLSKYKKLDPFKIKNKQNSTEVSDGKGGRRFGSIDDLSRDRTMSLINQSMDDEGTTTIAIQQVNTIQTAYVPMPIPMKSRSMGSTSSPTLSQIWSA